MTNLFGLKKESMDKIAIAEAMGMSRCASCDAPIVWVRMRKSGRMIPMDTKPYEDGNLARVGIIDGELTVEVTPPGPNHRDPLRFKSHFATCSEPAKDRQTRRAGSNADVTS